MARLSPGREARRRLIGVAIDLRKHARNVTFALVMESNVQSAAAVDRPSEQARGLTIPAWGFMVGFIVVGTLFHIWLHHTYRGTYNLNQIAIAFFLMVNLLVNFWEIGLLVCANQIHDEYEATKDAYRGRETDRFDEMFRKRIPLLKVFSFWQWTEVWSSYALFDPGYASKSSFGFNIDGGNGWSTPIFATMFAFGMTFDFISARVLGIIGVVMFWQMFYGTVIYFFQFFNAGRHKGHSPRTMFLFIGTSNGLWFIFPLWGMALSIWMILNDSYTLFY